MTELKFYMPTNEEVNKMCLEMAKSDYKKLATLYLCGHLEETGTRHITTLSSTWIRPAGESNLSDIKSLNLLTEQTKQAITTLFLNNNKLISLNGLEGFTKINKLYLNNNSAGSSSLELGTSLSNMTNLNVLFCGYDNITNENFQNLSVNKNITSLSIPGNTLIKDLNILVNFEKLTGLQARNNGNFLLNEDSVIQKIAGLLEFYFDDKYSTRLALANIGSEVYLGTDATDTDIDVLLQKEDSVLQGVKYFEIPNNKFISDDKLQNLLKKLTNLEILLADGTKLSSFEFIGQTNDKLEYISVFDTSILDLENLKNCTNLKGININTSNLDLKNYSEIVSSICNRNGLLGKALKGGVFYCGGFNTTPSILNTLNGKEQKNEKLTCFGSYGDPAKSGKGTVDFTNTGLKELKAGLWNALTIKLPTGFESYSAELCTGGCTLDYTNLTSAERYDCQDLNSVNFENFTGYASVLTCVKDPTSIIGDYTTSLSLGKCRLGSLRTSSKIYELSKIVSKGKNITDMTIWGASGMDDISVLSPLSLVTLEIQYSSLYGLKSQTIMDFAKMGQNLTSLKISNCTSFNNLDGLDKLSNIETLDLSNNKSLGNIQTVTGVNGQKESKYTCQYIAESLPNLTSVDLSGCDQIKDFNGLTSLRV